MNKGTPSLTLPNGSLNRHISINDLCGLQKVILGLHYNDFQWTYIGAELGSLRVCSPRCFEILRQTLA